MGYRVNLEEISDGRLYGPNDMVKADCRGCEGCSACCQGMGSSIVLDPYDVYRLTTGLGKSMEELLEAALELNVAEGVILPNLKMCGQKEQCAFLNAQGRCSIHPLRPGICRLFPLGRVYEESGEGFKYFLQRSECTAIRSKVKVSKWIDTPQLARNMEFTNQWHGVIKKVRELLEDLGAKETGEAGLSPEAGDNWQETARQLNLLLLNLFFFVPYDGERDFYQQFQERREIFASRMEEGKA